MYNLLTKHGQTFALGLGVLVIAIFLGSAISGLNGAGYDLSTDLNKLGAEQKAGISFFDPGLKLTIALAVIAAVLAFVVFGVLNLLKFPKSSLKFILGFIVLLVIFFALYSTSAAESTGKIGMLVQREDISDAVSKMISGGLKTTVGLSVLAVVMMVGFELRNLLK